ncbi:MAG: 6-phosphogluconolactonase [Planctomycetota bacterium]
MDLYGMTVDQLPEPWKSRTTVVPDNAELNRRMATEFADMLEARQQEGGLLTVIAPVGPVDYRVFAEEVVRRGLSCRHLRTVNMDEYVDDHDQLIPKSHPLSFRRHMDEMFFNRLPEDKRPLPENIVFPDPAAPHLVTELIDRIGGADLCWAGFGITGHLAFNDPPHMTGEPTDLASFRNCKTRVLRCGDMSTAQMAIGGTHGNLEIIPPRATTIGMYELLKTKNFRLTFMRNWHAGLWRRALLGPVTAEFPGSLMQEHPNITVTLTELAAELPVVNTHQDTGE